jgi:SAM-dependent methyltransferase
MQPEYASAYRELYERHWWWRARERAVLAVLRRRHVARPGDRVLDIGCGDGLFFERLSAFGTVEGVEPDPLAVSAGGPQRGRIHVRPFDATFDPGHRFRLIVMLDVLEHLDDADGALRHIRRLLAPEGTLVVTVPALRCLWTAHDDMNRHVTRYAAGELRAAAGRAGLDVVEMHYLFHWMAAAKLAVRLKERLVGAAAGTPRIPPAWLNRLLETVTALDLRGGRGWGLPFGSSLIAVLHGGRADDAAAQRDDGSAAPHEGPSDG